VPYRPKNRRQPKSRLIDDYRRELRHHPADR
jgi:hypothetical protein